MLICTGFSVSGYSYPYWKFAVGILLIYILSSLYSFGWFRYTVLCECVYLYGDTCGDGFFGARRFFISWEKRLHRIPREAFYVLIHVLLRVVSQILLWLKIGLVLETCSFSIGNGCCFAVFPLSFTRFSFFLIWLSIKKDGFWVLTQVKFRESVFLVLIELFKEMPIY